MNDPRSPQPDGTGAADPPRDAPDHSIWARPKADAQDERSTAAEQVDEASPDAGRSQPPVPHHDPAEPDPPPHDSAQPDPASSDAPQPEPASVPPPIAPAGVAKTPRSRRAVAGLAAGAVFAAGAVGIGVYALGTQVNRAPTPTASTRTIMPASATPLVTADRLLTDADARLLAKNAGWKVALTADATDANSPQPLCIEQRTDGEPVPVATALRTFTTASARKTAALHQIDGYATAKDAEKVFALRAEQLGSCSQVPSHIAHGYRVSGLGDEAVAVGIALQNAPTVFHTLVLNRTGSVLNILDVAQTAVLPNPLGVAKAAAQATTRQCKAADGMCPVQTAVTPAPPPAAGLRGWLVEFDLPRITPAAGVWTTSPPVTNLTVQGSGCENVDLRSVRGPKTRAQRTYLLTQDDAAPQGFGVDEVLYTFDDEKAAAKFAARLTKNVAGCEKRVLTAKVDKADRYQGTGARGASVAVSSYAVSQEISRGKRIRFRVAVITTRSTVSYLLATPGERFDFSDRAWRALTLRAGERIR